MFLGKLSNNDNEPRTIKPQTKLHPALRPHTATCASHGNRVSDCVNQVLRNTELIILIGIVGILSVLRFMRTLSDTRAILREAGRV